MNIGDDSVLRKVMNDDGVYLGIGSESMRYVDVYIGV